MSYETSLRKFYHNGTLPKRSFEQKEDGIWYINGKLGVIGPSSKHNIVVTIDKGGAQLKRGVYSAMDGLFLSCDIDFDDISGDTEFSMIVPLENAEAAFNAIRCAKRKVISEEHKAKLAKQLKQARETQEIKQ